MPIPSHVQTLEAAPFLACAAAVILYARPFPERALHDTLPQPLGIHLYLIETTMPSVTK